MTSFSAVCADRHDDRSVEKPAMRKNTAAASPAALQTRLKFVFHLFHNESINRTASMLLDVVTVHRGTSRSRITMHSAILPGRF
jgi:hypothetical protein